MVGVLLAGYEVLVTVQRGQAATGQRQIDNSCPTTQRCDKTQQSHALKSVTRLDILNYTVDFSRKRNNRCSGLARFCQKDFPGTK